MHSRVTLVTQFSGLYMVHEMQDSAGSKGRLVPFRRIAHESFPFNTLPVGFLGLLLPIKQTCCTQFQSDGARFTFFQTCTAFPLSHKQVLRK